MRLVGATVDVLSPQEVKSEMLCGSPKLAPLPTSHQTKQLNLKPINDNNFFHYH